MKKAFFWGAGWGLAEATVGHVLHVLRIPGLAGFVMIPVGLFMMSRAFKEGGGAGAVALTSAVAASLKFLDLLLPPSDLLAVTRPAMAILAEGFAVSILFAATSRVPGFLFRTRVPERTVGGNGKGP